jgi:hypothetical protein
LKTKAAPITIELAYKRSTQGTHVFAARDPAAPVPTIYSAKTRLGAEPPKKISLTIAPAEWSSTRLEPRTVVAVRSR